MESGPRASDWPKQKRSIRGRKSVADLSGKDMKESAVLPAYRELAAKRASKGRPAGFIPPTR